MIKLFGVIFMAIKNFFVNLATLWYLHGNGSSQTSHASIFHPAVAHLYQQET